MNKIITEENLKTLDLIKELFRDKIKTNAIVAASLNSEDRYPLIIKKLLEKGEPFCFENEGDIPFIESKYEWILRMPNKKIEYNFDRFNLPISFKSYLKYLDEYTQSGFIFYIQFNLNESIYMMVDDLKFDKNSNFKTILTVYYENKEKNLDYCLDFVLDDYYVQMGLKANKLNHLYGSYDGRAVKLTDEIKEKYGINIPQFPLPF